MSRCRTVAAGHVNIHGHTHRNLKPAGSPHINVSVEQLDYRPVELSRLRRLAQALVAGQTPPGETTLERPPTNHLPLARKSSEALIPACGAKYSPAWRP